MWNEKWRIKKALIESYQKFSIDTARSQWTS